MNFLKIKKWLALMMAGVFPMAAAMFILFTNGDVVLSLASGFVVVMVMVLIGTKIYSHPTMAVWEGDGILGLTHDSTGNITPFLLKVETPYLYAQIGKEKITTTFDRESVNYMMPPKAGTIRREDGKVILELDETDYKNSLFSLTGMPTLFFNKHTGAFMTKEMLSTMETTTFVQHLVLQLNRRTDELSSHIRDFARYIVEQTRPKESFWSQPWFMGLLVVGSIIIFAVLFGPAILGQGATAAKSVGGLITPR